jgi:rod shape-determining protein MreD
MMRSLYIGVPLLFLLAVWQTAAQPYFPIFGITPYWPVLVALAWGLVHSPEEGVAWGLVAGLVMGLFSAGPMGSAAVALMAAVLITSLVQHNLPANRVVLPALLGGVGVYLYEFFHMGLVWMVGYGVPTAVGENILPHANFHGLLTVPIYLLASFVWRKLEPLPLAGIE